jgi:hypothetical protein
MPGAAVNAGGGPPLLDPREFEGYVENRSILNSN